MYSDPARTFKLAHFTYDAQGKRLMKESYATDGSTPTERTWYLRDASGAVISYIQQDLITQTRTEELPIAGVGSYLREAQTVRYDITDHLGNTRVSFIVGTNGLDVIEAHD
ncbi:MAG: hypothetical protein KDE53_03450, partial [Caldilineaceae bacterium]|nr:hypothetical protein [Caldilineaceae bacterium]